MTEQGRLVLLITLIILIGLMVFYNIVLTKLSRRIQMLEYTVAATLSLFSQMCSAMSDYADNVEKEEVKNNEAES